MVTLIENAQRLSAGEIISLYRLDTTLFGGQVYYFCSKADATNGNIFFGGLEYYPIEMEWRDQEISGRGQMPAPRIKIANTNDLTQSLVNAYGDMLGAPIQRVRTYKRFLDGESDADPTAYFGPDWFTLERKVSDLPTVVEWELAASFDQEGKKLPGRHVIRDTCPWRYRHWDANQGAFDYSKAQCPYTGDTYYDRSGNEVTNPAEDQCGRRLKDCELRFGEGNALPFGGFPGVARVRGG